jgi:hypothetical protein
VPLSLPAFKEAEQNTHPTLPNPIFPTPRDAQLSGARAATAIDAMA